MAALRRTYVACVLTAACSSADPSTDTASFQGVLAIDLVTNCNGACPEENVVGAALAQGSVWVTRSQTEFSCPNNSNCSISSTATALAEVSFQDGGTLSVLDDVPPFPNAGSLAWSGVDVASDGSLAYFVYADPIANHMVYQGFAGAADAGHVTQSTFGHVVGVVADQSAVVSAISPPPNNVGDWNQALDDGAFTGGGGPGDDTTASLYRVDLADGGISPARAVPMDTMASRHVLTSDATSVYGVGGGHVWTVPRDLSSPPTNIAVVPTGSNGCMNGSCQLIAPVGISVAGSNVVTAFLSATSLGGNQNTQPAITPTRCQIFNGGTAIFDVAQKGCAGVAADATYAYFAIVEQKQVTESCCGTQYYLATTSIARISLTGASTQVPSMIPINTTRFYGPRRFLVDDAFLYGIDPAYVFRIAKTSFK